MFSPNPFIAAAKMAAITNPVIPAGLTGLVIAAIFAAAMNGFGLNTVATITLCDLYRRYLRPRAGERESMVVLHSSTFAWGAAATAVALAMIRVKTVLDVWWELAGIFGGGMLGLFLLGRLSRRADKTCAAVGVAAGVVVILWMSLPKLPPAWSAWLGPYRSPFHTYLVIVFGTVTILGVGLLTAALRKPAPGPGFEPILPPATPAAPTAASTRPGETSYP